MRKPCYIACIEYIGFIATKMARTNTISTVLYTLMFLVQFCYGRMDCAQKDYDNADTNTGKVYCGRGFHECGTYGEACCNDVEASPVQLTLVILGPATLLCSAIFTFFVIKSVVGVYLENKQTIKSGVTYTD